MRKSTDGITAAASFSPLQFEDANQWYHNAAVDGAETAPNP